MEHKTVEKSAFCVIEKVKKFTVKNNENTREIPKFWAKAAADGTLQTLANLSQKGTPILGICYAEKTDGEFDYSIAAMCDSNAEAPQGYRKSYLPKRTWAVFQCVGAMPEAIQQLWRKIDEYFTSSQCRPTGEMDIEAYGEGDTESADYRCQIWVPVVENN